ncbi:hypothetical protein T492DRAFT_863877 [Pavlovales sp. CCMP2436]|nr:hypothetical protein T492DRAFT_863877 [Pavlovales sp. CCMP2436]
MAEAAPLIASPKDWTADDVRSWLCTCAAGRYARFAHRFGAVDGKRLSRMSVALMTNLVGDEELARKLFNELRNEMERIGALRQQQMSQ